MKIKTSLVIARTIRALGGDALFGMLGRGVYPLVNELGVVDGIRHVTTLNEFALVAAADGYARVKGAPSWVSLYMSTGTMNAMSAIFTAHRDHVPMVVLATQTEENELGANARAECDDILGVVRPVVKWAWQPPTADRVQEALIRAYTIARTPPMGPVFISLPVDYWKREVEYVEPPVTIPAATTSVTDFGPVAGWMDQAERPVIVVGGEAVMAGAVDAIYALADRTGAMVVSEPESSLVPGSKNPLYGGESLYHEDFIRDADFILYLGVNSIERSQKRLFMSGRAKRHVQIGSQERRFNENIPLDWFAMADIAPSVKVLTDLIKSENRIAPRLEAVKQRIAQWKETTQETARKNNDEEPMSVHRLFTEMKAALPENTTYVEHSTCGTVTFREMIDVVDPYGFIATTASNQGWGTAAAAGVKLAGPSRPVVAVVGDGNFMFAPQGLFTAAANEIAVIYVVLNNGGWVSCDNSIKRGAPDLAAKGLDLETRWNIDFQKLAESVGVEAVTVRTAAEVQAAIEKGLGLSQPFLINAIVSDRLDPNRIRPF